MRNLAFAALLLFSCDSGDKYTTGFGAAVGDPLNASVGQGGAQDFGEFRSILEEGNIPAPGILDDVGFFNEHSVPMPLPDCGQDLCVHGLLGVLQNMINGADCTVVLVGMNTPIDVETMQRPPLNLTVVVDASGSMEGSPIESVRTGLSAMLAELEPDDRLSVVTFNADAEVLFQDLPSDDSEVQDQIDALIADGRTNLYEGLRIGFQVAEEHHDPTRQNRLLLLSDGMTTEGITASDRILALAEGYNARGYGLSTVGVGTEFDTHLVSTLAELGGGAFYYLEDAGAIEEVFTEEINSFLVPLARDVELTIDVEDGWFLGGFYGTNLSEVDGSRVTVTLPSVQLAHRFSESDNELGRRGGGGAMLLELVPTDGDGTGEVGVLRTDYELVSTGANQSQRIDIMAPPDAEPGWVFDRSVEKGFVMLNLYTAFDMASRSCAAGEWEDALAVLDAVGTAAREWLDNEEEPDPDISDDLIYVDLFMANIEARSGVVLTPGRVAADPWPVD